MESAEIPVPDDEIREALARLLESREIAPKSGIRDILRYIVEEHLEGRSDRIKAYAIGIDALGRDEDFDPSSDSIVRVQVNRLRQALVTYYDGEGVEDPVRISIPRGSYRPAIQYAAPFVAPEPVAPEPVTAEPDPPSTDTAVPATTRYWPWAMGVAIAAVIALVLVLPRERSGHIDHTPIIDVRTFTVEAHDALAPTVNGVREQLVVDLAHMGTVEIRDLSAVPDTHRDGLVQPDYDLSGSTPFPGDVPRLLLKLSATDNGNVVWSKTLDLPENDAEFYTLLRDAVGGIAVELAGKRGAVPTDIIQRLDLRLEKLGDAKTTDYECLLLAYTYDTTKDAKAEQQARSCLSRLTAAGSKSSAIWAEHALASFLSASAADNDDEIGAGLNEALSAARTAAQLDPYNAIAHEYMGNILSGLNRRKEAIAAYKRGLELAPATPTLQFLLGWQMVLLDDWDGGMALIRRGVEKSPFPPGWMRIPLAFDAFRRGEYAESLDVAKAVIQLGDSRGVALAFGAASAMGDEAIAAGYFAQMRLQESFDPKAPFHVLAQSWSNPSIIEKYERVGGASGLY